MSSAVQIAKTLKAAGNPTFSYGAGRNAKVTIFGATGFLGRYVAFRLGKLYARVNMPNRGCELEVRHLKPSFSLGDAWFPFYNLRDESSIRQAIGDSDIIVNLVGKYYETKHVLRTIKPDGTKSRINFTYEDINETFPRTIARLSSEMGVRQLIHVSALAANESSESRWARTKAAGEKAVMEEFPDATIIKPAPMFGSEDRLLNWIADIGNIFKVVPLVDGGHRLLQPVWVQDVAEVIVGCIDNTWHDARLTVEGKTIELAGPHEYSWRELAEFVNDIKGYETAIVDVRSKYAALFGKYFERMPVLNTRGPYYCQEDALRQQDDILPSASAAERGFLSFDHFEMKPTQIEDVAFSYLYRYRKGGHFAREQGYH